MIRDKIEGMTPVIYSGLEINPDIALCRNTDHNILTGTRDGVQQGWTWMLKRGDKPLIIIYGEDLEPIERYFLQAFHYPVEYPLIFGNPLGLQA